MIKAIETQYRGHKFRSRLEARCAVFFDALGIEWDYEREGYDLGSEGFYLPDFILYDSMWMEIKGLHPTDDEIEKIRRLAKETDKNAFIQYGNIKAFREDKIVELVGVWVLKDGETIAIDNCMWCVCPSCGALQIAPLGTVFWPMFVHVAGCDLNNAIKSMPESELLKYFSENGLSKEDLREKTIRNPTLVNAFIKATSARFEHGEEGA